MDTGVRLAVALPWWGYLLAAGAAVALAWLAYARLAVRLSPRQRTLLVTLRAVTLIAIGIILLRPVQVVPAAGPRDGVVAVLVDTSRSMRLTDTGVPRIERARQVVEQLQTSIGAHFATEVYAFGDALTRSEVAALTADARRSDLTAALAAVGERFRGRRLAAVVVVSDGGDTGVVESDGARGPQAPIYTVGIGERRISPDREINNLTAGEPLLSQSSVDLSLSVISHGLGTAPIEVRVSENGRPIETRRLTPGGDGVPLFEVFTVSPAPDRPTVYTVEIPPATGEIVTENNRRSILVPPQGRRRTLLLVEGAPGFEHTFLKRALARDLGLEVDSVVRKGQNDEGRDTFFIQAGASRAGALVEGYPTTRAQLFAYDAIFFGNVEGEFFTRDQLAMTADFVATRGGGLLVFGARSFERAGLVATPLEETLPVDFTAARTAAARTPGGDPQAASAIALTADGVSHPATRLALTPDDSRQRWGKLPPLAAVTVAGAPRAGAQVLATAGAGPAQRPLIVTQRYGQGRSMVFAGEASWRWRMLQPSADTSYELVWRQLARWLAASAVDRITIPPPAVAAPGTTDAIAVLVRDEEFRPVADAEVTLRITEPGGQQRSVAAALATPAEGRYTSAIRFDQPGVYTLAADVRRRGESLGAATRPLLVGGVDVELAQPQLNEAVLQRVAERGHGAYVAAGDAGTLAARITEADAGSPPTELRDLWHNGFSLALIIALLATEWLLRRRAGLA